MLRLGEETGQLPMLAGRVAEFYQAKLHRSLDRIVGIVGPAAIVTISVVVGGLIVSVMTSLLSVTPGDRMIEDRVDMAYASTAAAGRHRGAARAPRRARLHAGGDPGRHHDHRR